MKYTGEEEIREESTEARAKLPTKERIPAGAEEVFPVWV
jgi:hypothetical protein